MRITQGTFSFLPDLTDAEIAAQIQYAIDQGWACSVEYTDDPHPRNTYWEMYGLPMFGLKDAAGVMLELNACRKAFPSHYIKINAFDSTRGIESIRLSFLVNRPAEELGNRGNFLGNGVGCHQAIPAPLMPPPRMTTGCSVMACRLTRSAAQATMIALSHRAAFGE